MDRFLDYVIKFCKMFVIVMIVFEKLSIGI
jgi:hypothetical protein